MNLKGATLWQHGWYSGLKLLRPKKGDQHVLDVVYALPLRKGVILRGHGRRFRVVDVEDKLSAGYISAHASLVDIGRDYKRGKA